MVSTTLCTDILHLTARGNFFRQASFLLVESLRKEFCIRRTGQNTEQLLKSLKHRLITGCFFEIVNGKTKSFPSFSGPIATGLDRSIAEWGVVDSILMAIQELYPVLPLLLLKIEPWINFSLCL